MRDYTKLAWLELLPFLLLAGCGHDGAPSSTAATNFPTGVLTDATSMPAIRGIYPESAQDAICCWVSEDVRFRTVSDPDAKAVRLRIWVPTFKPWATDPGYVAEVNAKGSTLSKVFLKSGPQDVTLPISKNSMNSKGDLLVRLHFSGARVPKSLGLNEDVRNISAMILNVTTI